MITKYLPKGQVSKRVWEITFFGLKSDQELENRQPRPQGFSLKKMGWAGNLPTSNKINKT